MKFDKEKSTEKFNNLLHNTIDAGKKAMVSAKDGFDTIVERTKSEALARRIKKYNPLFPEKYKSSDFNLPNMIMIVDDAERRDIAVCEGAIGWLGKESDIEILYLYDEAIEFSGITFIPSATCDAVYYVDNYDRNRFIRVDCIFSKAHEERLAELKHIAHALGAKNCSIEIVESQSNLINAEKGAGLSESVHGTNHKESYEQSISTMGTDSRSGKIEIEFEGSSTPIKPTLKWFTHDDNINRLIDMRCNNANSIKRECLELQGSSSATMSQKTAYAIDNVLGNIGGTGGQMTMNSQSAKEHQSKMIYRIEF